MKPCVRDSERGFTLIELMVASAISLIVIGGIFGVMISQQTTYTAQMDLSEASQNARAALDIVRQSLRDAGWGFIAKETAVGLPPVGTCYAADVNDQSACNDLVAYNANGSTLLSDRIRISGIEPGKTFTRDTAWDGTRARAVTQREALAVNELAIISGKCTVGTNINKVVTGVVKITSVSGSVAAPPITYEFANVTNYPTFDCATVESGFAFGRAKIVEFYLDRFLANPDPSSLATRIPRLMMITNRGAGAAGAGPVEQTVAYDIESFHVRYALDCGRLTGGAICSTATNVGPDDIIDPIANGQLWCNDLTSANCNTGKTVIENQMRVMAVQVAVIPRTRHLVRKNSKNVYTGVAVPVFGYILPADAYRHWVYRATIALRNNQLPISN